MTYLKTKNLIVYSSTSSGMAKYFNANLTLPLSITTIASGLSATIYTCISPQETYIAIGDNSNKFKIYDISNLSLVYSLTATSGWAFKAFTWHPNGTVLFFANDQQDYFYYVNLSNSFQLKKSAAIYRPSNQWARNKHPYRHHNRQHNEHYNPFRQYNHPYQQYNCPSSTNQRYHSNNSIKQHCHTPNSCQQ